MDYQKIRNIISEGKAIVEKYKNETPQQVLEVCYSMFEINEMLVDKLEELDNKISKNSGNSSLPPSTDKNPPKKNQSLRGKTGKKPGGQPGHIGSTLKRVEAPDEIIKHVLKGKCKCKRNIAELNSKLHLSRQVHEVEIMNKVFEHQTFSAVCDCGEEHCSSFPEGVTAHVQYGESVRGIIGYLSKYQLIPYERLEEMMKDLFRTSVCEGTIENVNGYAIDGLLNFKEKFEEHIPNMKVGHSDETTTKLNGKLGFLHVLSDAAFSFLFFHEKRGMVAVDELGFLAKFQGTLIHDCFSMYFNYGRYHAVCCAHLLRELTFIEEKYKHQWAHEAKRFLLDLNELVHFYKLSGVLYLDKNDLDALVIDFEKILLRGRVEYQPLIEATKNKGNKRGAQHPALNLLNRMLKLQKEILKFAHDFDIPFTNNQAERDLRMAKVHLKISGGFRSEHGAQLFALFRSYILTARKHGISIFKALTNLYNPHHNETLDIFFKPKLLEGS